MTAGILCCADKTHYLIHIITPPTCSSLKVVPVGMSRGVKKLMQEKFPNMSKFEDISELLMKYGPQKCEF